MKPAYTYAVARVRTLEKLMVDEAKLKRMLEASDLESALFVLNETAYSAHSSKLANPFDFDELVRHELKEIRKLLETIAPNNGILKALWLKYDFHNAKVLLKSHLLENPKLGHYCFNLGIINCGEINKYLKGETPSPFKPLTEAMDRALIAYKSNKDIKEIEDIMDQGYLKYLGARVKDQGSKIPLFAMIVRIWQKEKRIFSKRAEDQIIKLIKKTKLAAFGVEPLIAFWLAKEIEAKTIEQILTGKLNQIDTRLIEERLREAYV